MPEFDLESALVTELPARLRARIGEELLPTIGTADNVDEALLTDSPLPAIYVIYSRGASKGQPGGGRRLTIGSRRKIKAFQIALAIVTESYASKEDGRLGAWRLMDLVPNAIDGWRATGMLKSFEFVAERLVIRTLDGTRVLHEQTFDGEAEILTAPVAP